MRVAFVGIGQSYPSHVWMRRMKQMLDGRVVVNIDDLRNTPQDALRDSQTQYIPKKLGRFGRAMRAIRLNNLSDERLRSEWMLRTLEEAKPSLVFVHFLDFAVKFADVWGKLDIPVVVHCHGYDITWDVRHHAKKTLLHPVGYQDQVRALPENVWFIANSNYTKHQLQQLSINEEKIFIKRFGVPLASRPQDLSQAKNSQILFLGRLVDFKGPCETVEAFSQVVKSHPEASLCIAGGGELMPSIETAIDSHSLEDCVQCIGPVSPQRGRELRKNSLIFTAHNRTGEFTQQQEAFGVSMLEAMGEGVPVVTGRSGGLIDFIHHEQNGMLFNPGDIDGHASALNQLLSSPKQLAELGVAAWETVRENYQTIHECEDLFRIFERASSVGSRPTLVVS